MIHIKDNYGINQLDYVIITHQHKDHIDDIINFEELCPKILNRPKIYEEDINGIREEDEYIFEKYFEIDQKYSKSIDYDKDPLIARNNGWAYIKIFDPDSTSSNLNNNSLVTIISYANNKIILPGDNEPSSWRKLLERYEFRMAIKGSGILLAPHHGRYSGFYSEIFEFFESKLTIVSDGAFKDTSATDRYSKISSGWTIKHRSGKSIDERKCLTTKSDGVVVIELGYDKYRKSFMRVTVE